MNAKQEELAYCQFVEDFLNYSFVKEQPADLDQGNDGEARSEGAKHDHLIMLISIP